jgi:hypothetical protein
LESNTASTIAAQPWVAARSGMGMDSAGTGAPFETGDAEVTLPLDAITKLYELQRWANEEDGE